MPVFYFPIVLGKKYYVLIEGFPVTLYLE